MKKVSLIGLLMALALLSACGGEQKTGGKVSANNTSTVSQIMESAANGTAAATETPAPTADTSAAETIDLSSADADVDLTRLSSTMVYSEVSQMIYSPGDFLGKTVKMTGVFNVYEGETRNYYACIISDATACCANGIEFVWSGDHAYPEDYPAQGAEITVTGTFDMYEEDGFTYIQLSDAALSF